MRSGGGDKFVSFPGCVFSALGALDATTNAFGLTLKHSHDHSIFDNDKLLKLRVDLIAEEFKELQEAIKEKLSQQK